MAHQAFKRRLLIATAASPLLAAYGCGGGDDTPPAPAPAPSEPPPQALFNKFKQTNLAATDAKYKAQFTFAAMVDAWGIAIRPAGAGGHFWVAGGGTSWQFVGDVQKSSDPKLRVLFQDDLKEVTLPGADSKTDDTTIGKGTGVVFIGTDLNSTSFRVTEQIVNVDGKDVEMDGSARFVFVTDSGVVSAWTDRAKDGSIVRFNGPAQQVFDGSEDGMQFFGVAIKPGTWDKMWLADFGANPQIRTLDKDWKLVPTQGFTNPFATGPAIDPADASKGKQAVPGDYVPFNIQVLTYNGTDYAFVAYAKSQPDEEDPTKFFAGEEDAIAKDEDTGDTDRGRLAMFDLNGKLVRVFEDAKKLNAPWGLAVAPATGFGTLSGKLLVGNFGGTGRITAYDIGTGKLIAGLKDTNDKDVLIEGLWGLQFGNGASLGDTDALYFAAGPADEVEGLFGSLRYAP
jgi:uncharacterized protein (TIGR03118 family)